MSRDEILRSLVGQTTGILSEYKKFDFTFLTLFSSYGVDGFMAEVEAIPNPGFLLHNNRIFVHFHLSLFKDSCSSLVYRTRFDYLTYRWKTPPQRNDLREKTIRFRPERMTKLPSLRKFLSYSVASWKKQSEFLYRGTMLVISESVHDI